MKYNFSKLTNRRNTNSMKWDVEEHELPMWVADMDFETAPDVIEAINKKASLGIYGYTIVPDEYFNAVSNWWTTRHNFKIEHEWIIFSTGVVPAISSIVRKMTTVGEKVLVQAPVYNIFYNSIVNNGRFIVSSDLVYDGINYHIDLEDLEQKLADPQTTMMILCNPHNPIGKIWDRDTLFRIGELCNKYHVLVVSDEIHCDLTVPGKEYIPFASVSDNCRMNSITCIAPTKAFNLAGLQTAGVVVPNEVLRYKVNRGLNTDEVAEPNVFAVEAAIAAFSCGADWLDELRTYIFDNIRTFNDFVTREISEVKVVPSEATYLMWIDCSKITDNSKKLCEVIRKETGLYISDGNIYGANGKQFIRVNVACPRERLVDGLLRLKNGIEAFRR